MVKRIDYTGHKYGRLLVQSFFIHKGNARCVCLCDCGKNVTAYAYGLRNGSIKSCGCLNKERVSTHGDTYTQVYKAWVNIKSRCFNPKAPNYNLYGGRGVIMDSLWKDDYIAFRDYIGHPPDDGQKYSIDRIDNNGNYEPGNVRWTTNKQQCQNKGMSRVNKTGVTGVNFDGEENRYTASWNTLEGKRKSKTFGINKYGKEEAFRLACEHRELMIKELNAQGAGYTENHGKQRE